MKQFRIRILAEILLFISGIALLFFSLYINSISYSIPQSLINILERISYSLITASITALIFEFILRDDFKNEIGKRIDEISDELGKQMDEISDKITPDLTLLGKRQSLDDTYIKSFNDSKNIDIFALSGRIVFEKMRESIFKKLKESNCDIKILILSKNSPIWKYRLIDDQVTKPDDLENDYYFVYKLLKEAFDEFEKNKSKGSFVVRTYDRLPYFAYFKSNVKMILGFYLSHKRGPRSFAYAVENNNAELYLHLDAHFKTLWNYAKDDILLRITSWEAPYISDQVVKSISPKKD